MIDASEILETDEFTTAITLPSGLSVKGVFDTGSEKIGLGYGIDAPAPQVVLAEAVASALNQGDRLTIGGSVYRVKTFLPDGGGLTVVDLQTV